MIEVFEQNMKIIIFLVAVAFRGHHNHIIETKAFQTLRAFFEIEHEYDAEPETEGMWQ